MSEVLAVLLHANLAAGLAVLVVLALRRPARRVFGPQVAYGLWALAPLAGLAIFLPSRIVVAPAIPADAPAALVAAAVAATEPAPSTDLGSVTVVAATWLAGVAASLAWLAWRQAAFARAARTGRAGPAAVGVLRPRIVTPDDFTGRYTAREQQVILAHEAAHIARHDPRINALVALARCVNWFNPLVHVLAHVLRIDQELACDAAVVAAHPQARRAYAEAMLKTQLARRPPPLGCYWPAPGVHPLAERVRLLARPGPGPARRRLGLALVTLLAAGAVGTAWASKPVNVVMAEPAIDEPAPAARPRPRPKAPPAPPRPIPPEPRGRTAYGPVVAPGVPETPAALTTAEAQADAGASWPPDPRPGPQPQPQPRPESRRIFAAAERSRVEPGVAVRVVARAIDAEGKALLTDLTSYGSQRRFRTGTFDREGSRHVLFTSVVQEGETFWVTAAFNKRFAWPQVGTVALRSGETRDLVLADGQVVTVSAVARPETPQEIAGAREHLREAEIDRARDSWRWLRERAAWSRTALPLAPKPLY